MSSLGGATVAPAPVSIPPYVGHLLQALTGQRDMAQNQIAELQAQLAMVRDELAEALKLLADAEATVERMSDAPGGDSRGAPM